MENKKMYEAIITRYEFNRFKDYEGIKRIEDVQIDKIFRLRKDGAYYFEYYNPEERHLCSKRVCRYCGKFMGNGGMERHYHECKEYDSDPRLSKTQVEEELAWAKRDGLRVVVKYDDGKKERKLKDMAKEVYKKLCQDGRYVSARHVLLFILKRGLNDGDIDYHKEMMDLAITFDYLHLQGFVTIEDDDGYFAIWDTRTSEF